MLCLLPARVTGRLSYNAKKLVKPQYFYRDTVKAYRYGPVDKFLFWGNLHPVLFSLLLGELLLLLAVVAGGHWPKGESLVAHPVLGATFDYPAFIGVPWAIQATLLALVYPLVISFVAIMMERKANSKIALRAYLVDSGVVPAGASSIALTLALTTQYVMSVYDYSPYVVAVLVFNWGWMALNVLLTGNFLARTIGFLNEEESQLAFKRLAMNVALWAEWVEVVTRNLYRNASSTIWRHVTADGSTPLIDTQFWKRAGNPVVRTVSGSQKLVDIHTGLFSMSIWLWRRRATRGLRDGLYKKPELVLSAQVGATYTGAVELCGVEEGPRLNRLEKYILGCAFVFQKHRAKSQPPSSSEMVQELVMEVEALTEARKFREARAAMERTREFHLTLLKSVQQPSGV